MTAQKTGATGEAIAVRYLEGKGYRIVAQNWHCSHGEIDIVAKDGATLVFCEVKTRRGANTAAAFVNITERKREKMIAAAHLYLDEHGLEDVMWRIDALAVVLPDAGQAVIEHVEDALDW